MDLTESIEKDAPTFDSWSDRTHAADTLVSEAAGWGKGVDQSDPEAMLAWARQYLPRVILHGASRVGP